MSLIEKGEFFAVARGHALGPERDDYGNVIMALAIKIQHERSMEGKVFYAADVNWPFIAAVHINPTAWDNGLYLSNRRMINAFDCEVEPLTKQFVESLGLPTTPPVIQTPAESELE